MPYKLKVHCEIKFYSNLFSPFLRKNATAVSFGKKEIGPYYWVGYWQNGVDYFAGQTFVTPASGILKRISLFPSIVYGNSDATLTVYEFDRINHTWQQKVCRGKNICFKKQWKDNG